VLLAANRGIFAADSRWSRSIRTGSVSDRPNTQLVEPRAFCHRIELSLWPVATAPGSDADLLEVLVSELDEAWALALAKAEARARAAGRTDLSEYLALRSSNDLIRKTASDWLLDIFESAAGEANRDGASVKVSRNDAHRFKVGNASMVGRSLSLGSGVRMLLVEVGWPRLPSDGFIRGGGLACSHIKHLGIKHANEELRLVLNSNGTPLWVVWGEHGPATEHQELHEANVRNHVELLLGAREK